LHNFFANHRDFASSREFSQIRGEEHFTSANNTKCSGARYIYEIFNNDTSKYKTFTGKPLKPTDFANPCGFVAKSFFNGKLIDKKKIHFNYLIAKILLFLLMKKI
jgi:hypothetical protein